MDVESYATQEVFGLIAPSLPANGRDQNIALVDIGAHVTHFYVLRNNQFLFSRDQAFGGNQLTQDIVRLYGLTQEEAELKKKTGELPDNYAGDILAPFVEQGAIDISRALQFFFTSTPYTRVDRIFLAGGSSVVPGLAEAVADRTQVPTDIFTPFQGMEFANTIRERQLKLDAPSLLVAAGLAMRRFDA
jgi:type IV pilus assembly protein PilM